MLNKRQEQLLAILTEKQDWMTSRQLSGLLGVTDRTIRSDIDAINRSMDLPPIESNVRSGYRVVGTELAGTKKEKTGSSVQELPEASDIPQTPGARCIYMIQKMLFETRELNLLEVQNQIYISDYSIQNDIKRIRKMIEPYPELKLVRNKERISL